MAPRASLQPLLLLAALLGVWVHSAHGAATLTTQAGQVLDLDNIYRNAKGKCCLSAKELGLGKVNGDQTIVRMDGSGGKYFVTNSDSCSGAITASAYSTTFAYLYVCGQCKGGCPQVDGGKTLVQAGGSCVKSDGSFDISKQCVASHPVCMSPGSGKCATVEEATAKPTTPPPTAVACASFMQLGQDCNDSQGKCCGGAPKNAKCTGGKCVTTYPSGRKALF